jgi:hypothetical protein
VKAPFAWSEFGLFSGGNERISPANFHIENIHKTNDGSFRAIVSMSYRPVDGSGSWHVIDRVIREDGRFVLDEVIFPKEGAEDEFTLSETLSEGCDRARLRARPLPWLGRSKVAHDHIALCHAAILPIQSIPIEPGFLTAWVKVEREATAIGHLHPFRWCL